MPWTVTLSAMACGLSNSLFGSTSSTTGSADPKRAEFGNAGRGADPEGVLAEPAVRGDGGRDLQGRVVHDLHLLDGDAGVVREDFLGVGQPTAGECDYRLGAALRRGWMPPRDGEAARISPPRTPMTQRTNRKRIRMV